MTSHIPPSLGTRVQRNSRALHFHAHITTLLPDDYNNIIFIDTQNLSNAANKQAPPLQLQASLRKMEALLAGLVFLASLTAESGQTNSKPASCCRLSNRLTPIPIHFRPDLSLEALPSETSQRNKFLLPVRSVS